MIPINVKQVREGARLPRRATDGSAGADICCVEPFCLAPGARVGVSTGLSFEIPQGYYGRVAPRSGLAVRHGIDVLAGVIDSDYRGELVVLLVNRSDTAVQFAAGDRIAQLIIEHAARAEFQWSERLGDTSRSGGGFGSTGS
jgi:dUTP diphosphatase